MACLGRPIASAAAIPWRTRATEKHNHFSLALIVLAPKGSLLQPEALLLHMLPVFF